MCECEAWIEEKNRNICRVVRLLAGKKVGCILQSEPPSLHLLFYLLQILTPLVIYIGTEPAYSEVSC